MPVADGELCRPETQPRAAASGFRLRSKTSSRSLYTLANARGSECVCGGLNSRRGGLRQTRLALDCGRCRLRLLLKRLAKDLADVFDEDKLHLAEQLFRNLLHV